MTDFSRFLLNSYLLLSYPILPPVREQRLEMNLRILTRVPGSAGTLILHNRLREILLTEVTPHHILYDISISSITTSLIRHQLHSHYLNLVVQISDFPFFHDNNCFRSYFLRYTPAIHQANISDTIHHLWVDMEKPKNLCQCVGSLYLLLGCFEDYRNHTL